MYRLSITATLTALFLFSNVMAKPPGNQRQGKRGDNKQGGPAKFERMMRAIPLLAALDADGDGTISATEIDQAAQSLKTLDKNGDGSLTIDELRPNFSAMGGRPGGGPSARGAGDAEAFIKRLFTKRDKDGDGKLTGDEIPKGMAKRLDKIDTNKDGSLSQEELKAMKGNRQGKGGGRPRGGKPDRAGGDKPRRPASNE